jgi:hypothetical protein
MTSILWQYNIGQYGTYIWPPELIPYIWCILHNCFGGAYGHPPVLGNICMVHITRHTAQIPCSGILWFLLLPQAPLPITLPILLSKSKHDNILLRPLFDGIVVNGILCAYGHGLFISSFTLLFHLANINAWQRSIVSAFLPNKPGLRGGLILFSLAGWCVDIMIWSWPGRVSLAVGRNMPSFSLLIQYCR